MSTRNYLALCLALAACNPKDEATDADTATGTATTTSTGEALTDAPTAGTTDESGAATSGPSVTTDTSESPTTDATTGSPVLCEGTGESSLTGVSIEFPPQPCTFTLAEAAAGLKFDYSVEIAGELSGVTRDSNTTCGEPGASGLIVSYSITGGDQGYCLCDSGLCPGPDPTPVTLAPGSFPDFADWNGTNWNGPSDTNNPYGPPFPPGDYTLRVAAIGTVDGAAYEVVCELPITLVP